MGVVENRVGVVTPFLPRDFFQYPAGIGNAGRGGPGGAARLGVSARRHCLRAFARSLALQFEDIVPGVQGPDAREGDVDMFRDGADAQLQHGDQRVGAGERGADLRAQGGEADAFREGLLRQFPFGGVLANAQDADHVAPGVEPRR